MKVLQICSKVPFPPTDGGTYAMHMITEGLMNNGVDVKVLAMRTPKLNKKPENTHPDYASKTSFESEYIDTSVTGFGAFLNLLTSNSYNISRFISAAFEKKLVDVLHAGSFDIVQLETLYTSPYIETIRKHSKAKVVFRAHNVESSLWQRIASETKGPLKRAYLKLQSARLYKYESAILNQFDGIAAITSTDADALKALGCKKPIATIPFGISNAPQAGSEQVEKDSIFLLAAMNWVPNQQGLDWFLDKVWDNVSKSNPALKFYIAGRFMPESLKQMQRKNVVVVGEVPDAQSFLASKNIMVVPLLSGGGMRIKIIEGMMMGKTIISTSIGAEGINYTSGKDILIADTPEEFANAISRCLQNDTFAKSIGEKATDLFKEKYNNDLIAKDLIRFYESIC